MSVRQLARAKIDLRLPPGTGILQYRELLAFVGYCVSRIERDLGVTERWQVSIAEADEGFSSRVVVHDGGRQLSLEACGQDTAVAIWTAMCRLEQMLREARAFAHAE